MSDTAKLIGQILSDNDNYERDAIHVAVLPVIAYETIKTGAPFEFLFGSRDKVVEANYEHAIGVIDPFIKNEYVYRGQKCWGFLKPGLITGLKHVWECPELDKQTIESKSESEEWLREFAIEWNFDYNTMIREAITNGIIVAHGIDLHSRGELGGKEQLFWEHIKNVTGQDFDDDYKRNFRWSCSC